MDDTPQLITSLVGREVYSTNGIYVGEVEDLQLHIENEVVTGLAVGALSEELFEAETEQQSGVIVPYRWVRAVGDVVLVNDVIERVRDHDEEEEEVVT